MEGLDIWGSDTTMVDGLPPHASQNTPLQGSNGSLIIPHIFIYSHMSHLVSCNVTTIILDSHWFLDSPDLSYQFLVAD